MANPAPEVRIHAIEEKIDRQDKKIDTLDEKLTGITNQVPTIQSDLGWHSKIGWGIAGVYAAIFGGVLFWLLVFHIPDKIRDAVPDDFKEKFGRLEQNVADIKEQFNRLTPNSLKQLIAPNQTPYALTANLREASAVVDTALRVQLPSDPALLAPIRAEVRRILEKSTSDKKLHLAATSLAVRLDGYQVASKSMLQGIKPITEAPLPEYKLPKQTAFFASFGVRCTKGSIAHAFGWDSPQEVAGIVFFDVGIYRCSQKLSGPQWINVMFDGATLEYNGGPLKLAGTTFKDCVFKFGDDPDSRRALAAVTAARNEPVNLLIE